MRHGVRGNQLGRPTNQAKALYRSLVAEVISRGRVETTLAKAKAVVPEIDRVINFGKKNTMAARRELIRIMGGDRLVDRIFEVAERHQGRNSGYSRVIRLGQRFSDSAERVILELVETGEAVMAPVTVKENVQEDKAEVKAKGTRRVRKNARVVRAKVKK